MSNPDTLEGILGNVRRSFDVPESELILPTPLGPIKVQDLTHLSGWNYDLIQIGFPGAEIPLVRGAAATPIVTFTDEMGWILFFNVIFRSEFALLRFSADSFRFDMSPFFATIGGLTSNNQTVYSTVSNPASPLGPLHNVIYTPSEAIPFNRLVELTARLPLTSPILTTTLFLAVVGRIQVKDKTAFLRSIKKFTLEQMIGTPLERFP